MNEVTVTDMLQARDDRVYRQEQLLQKYSGTLIYLTMNIPGPVKVLPGVKGAFFEGTGLVETGLAEQCIPITCRGYEIAKTGCEAWWTVSAPPERVKQLMTDIEEAFERGRLLDLDVLDQNGCKLSRQHPRRCLLCDEPAAVCARSRAHSVEEMQGRIKGLLADLTAVEAEAACISRLAREALEEEVLLTPKPGLVDQMDSGAHTDMNVDTFLKSASSIAPYIGDMYLQGRTWKGSIEDLFPQIRLTGQKAERAMFKSTGGVNTHKGAIFLLGILAASAGLAGQRQMYSAEEILEQSKALCERTMRLELSQTEEPGSNEKKDGRSEHTHGSRVYAIYGTPGIRGEAACGFPSVSRALAVLHGETADQAGQDSTFEMAHGGSDKSLYTLMYLMSTVEDTNVLYRCGRDGLDFMQTQALQFLNTSFRNAEAAEELGKMNRLFVEKRISPGGCADLLGGAIFIDKIVKCRKN